MSRRTTIPECLLRRPGVTVQGGLSSYSPLGRRLIDLWGNDPKLEAEYRFDLLRKFRFDFAHPASKVAIELHGGVHRYAKKDEQGRHVRPKGFIDDCEKWRLAASLGWLVFPFTSGAITRGEVERVKRCIENRLAVGSGQ